MAKSDTHKPPISSHPLFPGIVALWFAALFGLGCLVLPPVLLDRISSLSHISALIPAAAPPLGLTARLALAGSAALFGALAGFAIARRVSIAQSGQRQVRAERLVRKSRAAAEAPARKPISAKEELGSEALDAPTVAAPPPAQPARPSRRRALAMEEDNQPSTYLRQSAPLPGDAPNWADEHPLMAPMDAVMNRHAAKVERMNTLGVAAPDEPEAAPLELDDFAEYADEPATADVASGLAALKNAAPEAKPEASSAADAALADGSEADAFAAPAAGEPPVESMAEPAEFAEADLPAFAETMTFGSQPKLFSGVVPEAEPVAEEPPAQDEQAEADQPAAPAFAAPVPEAAPELARAAPPILPEPQPAADPAEPLDRLGMAELAERLGRSMARRLGRPSPSLAAALAAAAGTERPAPQPEKVADEAEVKAASGVATTESAVSEAAVERASELQPEPVAAVQAGAPPAPVIPRALRPFDFDLGLDDDGEDEGADFADLSFSLPLDRADAQPAAFASPTPAEAAVTDEDEEDAEESSPDAAYASLLALKRPFAGPAEFVRVEEPEPLSDEIEPAVVFPGSQPQVMAEAPTTTPSAVAPARTGFAISGVASAKTSPRPFDAPVAPNSARSAQRPDPAETERALRSALATLQRVSGAA